MSKVVEIPGVGNVEFPDSMSDSDIENTIKTKISPTKPEPTAGERLAGWGKQAVQSAKEFAGGAAAGLTSTGYHAADLLLASPLGARFREAGMKPILESPEARKQITPPPSTAGQLGFGAEQAAEYFIPVGPEIKGAGLAKGALRVGKEALKSGAIGGAQTGTWQGAGESAALGAGGEMLGAGMRKIAPKVYEHALGPAKAYSLEERAAMAERGVEAKLPFKKKSLDRLQAGINQNKAEIDRLTKGPASPYGARSIVVADVLKPVDELIAQARRADPELAEPLLKRRAHWVQELGGATTTVEKAQQLKEDLYAIINSGAYSETAEPGTVVKGRKLAARGLKEGIVRATSESVDKINRAIETDINLKEAITDAIKRKPGWVGEAATFVLGETAVEAIHRTTGREGKADYTAPLIGALTVAAVRSPAARARLAIMLRRAGAAMPKLVPAGGAATRQPAETSEPGAALNAPTKIRQALTAAGERHGVPPVVMHAVAQIESGGRPGAVSPKGATGLMQLMPATARQYGVHDVRNVAENIEGSARYLRHLWTKYRGNIPLVLAAYNAGEGAVDRAGGRVPDIAETREYVRRGMNAMRRPAA